MLIFSFFSHHFCTFSFLQQSISKMHINELPDVVLARIFHWVCNDPTYSFSTYGEMDIWRGKLVPSAVCRIWRDKLVPSAVCRIWRELALPSVHRVSFIQYIHVKKPKKRDNHTMPNLHDSEYLDSESSDSESTGTQSNASELGELEDKMYTAWSNLDIISNTSSKFWPRTIRILVKASNNPIYSMQRIIDKIRNHTTLLTKVVRIELDYTKSPTIIPRLYEATDIADPSSIGEELSQLIPHVRYIEFGDHIYSDIFIKFAQSLVKGYAHQLTGFECPQFALGKVQCFSDNLRHVCINGDRDTRYMPQICAENLTHLTLNRIGSYFDWSSFESNGRPRSLHFDNLKWLKLTVDIQHGNIEEAPPEVLYFAREFNYKVIAPQLKTVTLRICPFTLSFMASIYGLATIHNVELELESGSVYFTEFVIDMVRDKFASYAKNNQDNFHSIDDCVYMNDMFNMYGLAKSSKVVMIFDDLFDLGQMDWKYLSNIRIYSSFHVNDLRTLVSKAPSLEAICFSVIEIKENGKLPPEIQDETATVEPLSPNLKLISFDYIADSTESERDKFMVYLSKLTLKD